jgi:hypothetical protein
MSMPRFTADASLYTSNRTYQGAVSPVRSGAIIQLAVHFPFFDDYNRCGCNDLYRACMHTCSPLDDPVSCFGYCRVSAENCYAYCNYWRFTLPPSVVGPFIYP